MFLIKVISSNLMNAMLFVIIIIIIYLFIFHILHLINNLVLTTIVEHISFMWFYVPMFYLTESYKNF